MVIENHGKYVDEKCRLVFYCYVGSGFCFIVPFLIEILWMPA